MRRLTEIKRRGGIGVLDGTLVNFQSGPWRCHRQIVAVESLSWVGLSTPSHLVFISF